MQKMIIDKETIHKLQRKANREAEIEFQTPRMRHTIQKSKKQYSRKEMKKIIW
jgi:hypothetical protein